MLVFVAAAQHINTLSQSCSHCSSLSGDTKNSGNSLDVRVLTGGPFMAEIRQVLFKLPLGYVRRNDDVCRRSALALLACIEYFPARVAIYCYDCTSVQINRYRPQ